MSLLLRTRVNEDDRIWGRVSILVTRDRRDSNYNENRVWRINIWSRNMASAVSSTHYWEVHRPWPRHLSYHNGVVTASSHALWRVLSNKVMWMLGHIQICRFWVSHFPCCTLFLINCFGIEMCCCAICISRGLIWQNVCYLTISKLLFGTNYVVMITQYWSWNHFHQQWFGRQNKSLQIKCILV